MTETYPLPPVRVVQPFEDMTTWERTAHLLARHNLAAAELGTQVERHDRRHAMDLDLDHSHDAEDAIDDLLIDEAEQEDQ